MLAHLHGKAWLQETLTLLSSPVSVERGWKTSQEVWGCLLIILVQVLVKSGPHVPVVVLSRVDGWEQHAACPSVELSGHEPDWKNDSKEVSTEQEKTLLRVLNLD